MVACSPWCSLSVDSLSRSLPLLHLASPCDSVCHLLFSLILIFGFRAHPHLGWSDLKTLTLITSVKSLLPYPGNIFTGFGDQHLGIFRGAVILLTTVPFLCCRNLCTHYSWVLRHLIPKLSYITRILWPKKKRKKFSKSKSKQHLKHTKKMILKFLATCSSY